MMNKEKVTSMQVAKLAGVSQSAVSRVFTKGASASQKTVDKVKKAADELGYRPNVLARAMVSGKSRIIGLVVAYLDNQFYPQAIEKLSQALQEQGYHILIFLTSKTEDNIDKVVDEILDHQVDGIIAASVALSSELAQRCAAAGVPVVLFNRSQDGENLSSVTSDNFSASAKAARFLLAGGHQRIAYIAGWEGTSTSRDREIGFVNALEQAGQKLYAKEIGNFTREEASEATHRLFAMKSPPDAIFVANDHMALAVMDTLRYELGLKVPDEVSIIGFDDVPASSWPAYNLTTLRQRSNLMVAETIKVLLEQIDGKATTAQQVAIGSPLIVRNSARIPDDW